MRRQSSRAQGLVALCVVFSLCTFSCIVYFYAHLHVLTDGRILVHSHALPKGEKSHSHTPLELFVLDQQFEQKSVTLAAFILHLFWLALPFLFSSHTQLIAESSPALFYRRAPPTILKVFPAKVIFW
ncbi:hypothetical protein JW998_15640 [candidate division KSB1 bacterium]|nr:hypothetical protein [candidate division KSB1 bacterium]